MTTLASNAPPQPAPARARKTDARAPASKSPAGEETERTLASRFIILVLCLTVALSTLAFGTVHSWSLAVFYMGACAVVVAWVADAWRTRRLRFSRNVLQLPLAALILLGLVQLVPLGTAGAALPLESARTISFDPYATRFVLIQLVALFVYFAAALSFIDSQKRLRLVVRMIIIFAFALAVVSMILFFISPDRVFGIREMKQSQGFGPFINRHHFAAYMELALALPLGLLFSGALAGERRPLYIFAAALMGISIILTNSRGGMVSLVAEIMFLVMVSGVGLRQRGDKERGAAAADGSRLRGALKRAALGVAIIVALFTGVLFFGGESALNRLVGTVNAEDPTTGRMHFWRGTLGIIRDHPVVGVGLGGFSAAYSKYDTSNGKLFRLEQAHNDYLQTLSDAGLVGAALGLFFIVALFRMSFRRMQSNSSFRRGVALGALTGCFALLVHSFFDFTLHTTANALLFLLLAALATINGRVEHTSRRRKSSSSSRRPPPNTTQETPALEQGGETQVAAET